MRRYQMMLAGPGEAMAIEEARRGGARRRRTLRLIVVGGKPVSAIETWAVS